jgi:hypothetical protein
MEGFLKFDELEVKQQVVDRFERDLSSQSSGSCWFTEHFLQGSSERVHQKAFHVLNFQLTLNTHSVLCSLELRFDFVYPNARGFWWPRKGSRKGYKDQHCSVEYFLVFWKIKRKLKWSIWYEVSDLIDRLTFDRLKSFSQYSPR